MKKSTYFLIATVLVAFLAACGGGGNNKKLNTFAESFAEFVTSGDMDSVKAYYPTADFDSLASLRTDSIQITQNDSVYKINYGSDKWIDVKMGEDGAITVVNSKGIASFPKDKYKLAVGTGMMPDGADDVQAQKLLNDSAYFDWLNKKYLDNGNYKIKITPGKYKSIWKPMWGEGSKGSITVTLTNLTDTPISGEDYTVTYKTNESNGYTDNSRRNYTKNNSAKGKDLGPKGTATISLSQWETYKFYDFKIRPAAGKEELLTFNFKPTGKEYQEYLDSKK